MTDDRYTRWSHSYSNDLFWVWLLKNPSTWTLWLRRAMFVTLPVSGLVWVAACVAVTILFWASIVPIAIFNTAKGELWDRD
jgi:hypothetical protein